MNIIGIHYGHDSNVTLLKDGKCVMAISEERLTRIKYDNSWPQKSLEFIINKFNIDTKDIDYVAIVGRSRLEETSGGSLIKINKKFGININAFTRIISPIINFFDNIFTFLNLRKGITIRNINKKIKNLGIDINKIIFLDHHFCHAIGAFHASEYNNALIFTCGGKGDDSH